ncbi:MAG: hypothetical protein C4294_02250 [Nitrospiraceae bacterium]
MLFRVAYSTCDERNSQFAEQPRIIGMTGRSQPSIGLEGVIETPCPHVTLQSDLQEFAWWFLSGWDGFQELNHPLEPALLKGRAGILL